MESIKYRSPELIPGDILQRKDITVSAKRVYAQIRYSQAANRSVSLSMGWIASRLGLSRQAVSRAAELLCERGLLHIHHQDKSGTVFQISRCGNTKKFFLPLYSMNSRHSISTTFIYCLLKFRQGKNDKAWPHLHSIAEDLGLSKAAVCRSLALLEKEGFIKIDHCNGGIGQGNKYQITGKPFFVMVCDTRSESRVSKHDTYNNTIEEFKENHNQGDSNSSEVMKKTQLLRTNGVAKPVATAIAGSHTLKNVENAVITAVCQGQLARQQGRKFSLAGYIVGILNRSEQQGRPVELNLFAKSEVEQIHAAQKAAEGKRSLTSAISQADRERALDDLRRRNAELANGTAKRNVPDSIRRMLGVA